MSGRWSLPQESLQSVTMAGALLSFALLSFFAGINSQPTLTQPASQSVNPGQTATISCSKSSGSWSSYINWVQQKPGQSPRFVHCNGCSRGEGIPDRITASASGNTGTLTITNVQVGDEADYICYAWSQTASMFVFGAGTVLSILNGSPVAPSVRLYAPSEEEIKREKKATLVCLMDGFNPGVVKVDWEADGTPITSGVQTSKPTKQGNKYLASSYLSLTAAEWERHNTYNCKVTHEGNIIKKTVQRS